MIHLQAGFVMCMRVWCFKSSSAESSAEHVHESVVQRDRRRTPRASDSMQVVLMLYCVLKVVLLVPLL